MSKINNAIHDIHHMDYMASQDKWLNQIHPLVKLLITLIYILLVVSFNKYNLTGLSSMILYLIITMIIGDISFKKSLSQLKPVLLLVCMVGIANPFLDKTVITKIGNIAITTGIISMITLMLKGIFAVLASYILIVTTSIESICYALRLLHVPKLFVTLVLLIYRYIVLLLKEVERITIAYSMRAPNQKGISYKVWGSLVGQLLLRSIDRAQIVYESMTLRGYKGEFYVDCKKNIDKKSIVYFIVWIILLLLFRFVPIFEIVGGKI